MAAAGDGAVSSSTLKVRTVIMVKMIYSVLQFLCCVGVQSTLH